MKPVTLLRVSTLAALALLAGCATEPKTPPVRWVGGDPTHLTADRAACAREADALDPNQANGYSDPRYGVTSAMANAIGRDNPLTDQRKAVRLAAFDTCMNDKGWKMADQPLAAADH
jgi:hypothetical protein